MKGASWNFPALPTEDDAEEEGYESNDIEAFKGVELYSNLVRETCQNSLDAKDPVADGPVVVKYRLENLNTNNYSFFQEYKQCLIGCRRYWMNRPDGISPRLNALLEKALAAIESGKVSALIVSDYNTTGLLGSKPVENEYGKSYSGSFNALLTSIGVSHKESENSAGSFGIGKNAPFACSFLSCVCYNTKATDGGEAFIGIAKLATTLNEDNKKTRRQGKYQLYDTDLKKRRPIKPSDGDDFAEHFEREKFGTDVIILGFETTDDWENQLKKAALSNFFVAISQRKLEIEIQGETINADNISKCLDGFADDKDMKLTRQFYKALIDPDEYFNDLNIIAPEDAELYIRLDDEIETLRSVALLRSSGMLITTYKPQGIFRPYVAVFIAKGQLDSLLRKTEPARHNCWDPNRVDENQKVKREAQKAVSDLRRAIKDRLNKVCEEVVDDDMDIAGASEFLPDDVDGESFKGGGTDILKPLVKIGKSRRMLFPNRKETTRGKRGKGKVVPGGVRNSSRNPNPESSVKPSEPVSGSGDQLGVSEGKGTKTIVHPVSGDRRIFAIAPDAGIYRLIILPEKTSDDVFLRCTALGEDGSSESLNVKMAKMNGKTINIDRGNDLIGPFSIAKDERNELILTFEEHGNMVLDVDLEERSNGNEYR